MPTCLRSNSLLKRAVYLLLLIFLPAIVLAQPANDLCTSATILGPFSAQDFPSTFIINLPQSSVGATTDVIVGTACSVHPSNEVWYKVNLDDFTMLTISTCGSGVGPTFDTVVAVYSGNCNALTCVAFNDDSSPACGLSASAASIQQQNLTPQVDYYIAVGGKPSGSGGFPLSVSVAVPVYDTCSGATIITSGELTPLVDLSILDSELLLPMPDCAPSAQASNIRTMWFTFYSGMSNSVSISSCGLPGVTPLPRGQTNYLSLYTGSCTNLQCINSVSVQNTVCGGAPSMINQPVSPNTQYFVSIGVYKGPIGIFPGTLERIVILLDDQCSNAITITSGVAVSGSNYIASDDTESGGCAQDSGFIKGVWFKFNSGSDDRASLSLCGSDFNTVIGLYSGDCGSLVCVANNDDGSCGTASELNSIVIAPGTQYYVVVGGKTSSDVGTFSLSLTLTLSSPPVNDFCSTALPLVGSPQTSNALATDDLESGGCVPDSGFIKGLWYTFNAGSDTKASLSLCGANFDSVIGLYSGQCGALVCVANNDDGSCGSSASELNSVTITPGAQYYVAVGGKTSSDVGSFSISLTLFTPPVNDFCASALPLAGAPQTSNALATDDLESGGCVPDSGFIKGLWYTFNAGSDTAVSLSLCGASFDSVIGLYSGQCGSLACVARNDDSSSCAPASELTSVVITPGTQYYVAVGGRASSDIGTFTLTGTIFTPPPVNDQCSAPTSITSGSTLTGTNVAATSDTEGGACSPSGLIGNVWYTFNSGGATLASLSLCGASFDTVIGLYSGQCGSLVCVTRNDDSSSCSPASELNYISISTGTQYLISVGGKTASSIGSFSLSLNLFAPPANDDPCLGAAALASGIPVPGTTIAATDDTVATACTPSGLIGGVWYSFLSGSNTVASLSVCGANFDSVIGLYTGNCVVQVDTLVCVASNDDGSSGCSPASELNNVLIAPNTRYYVVVGGKTSSDFGTFTLSLTLSSIPLNDLCSGAVQLFDGVPQSGTTAGALDDSSSIVTRCGLSGEAGSNVWYYFDVPSAGYLSVSSCVASFDTVIGIYQGSCANLNCVGFNDNNSPGCAPLSSSVTILAKVPSTRYFILVSGIGGATGNFQVTATFTASGLGGDPHVLDFAGQKYDIPPSFDGKILSIYHDHSLRIHVQVNKKPANTMFLTGIGASFIDPFLDQGKFNLEAKLVSDRPSFFLNDREISDSFDFPVWMSVSEPKHQFSNGIIGELGKYHTVELHVNSLFTIVGGFHPRIGGFFNIQLFRNTPSELSKSGLLQAEITSSHQLQEFVREHLFDEHF